MFALLLTGLAITASFTLDLSQMYLVRQRNQLVSDLATLAAVNTESPIVGNGVSRTAAATAKAVAVSNAIDPAGLAVTVTASPAAAGALALRTAIADDIVLPIGLVTGTKTARVSVASWGEVDATGACFRSQHGPTNIYDNAIVNAPACAAEARTYLYSCGSAATTLAAVSVGYSAVAERPYLCDSATIVPGADDFAHDATVTDTMASSAPVTGMLSHLDGMANGWPYGTNSPVRPLPSGGTPQTFSGTTSAVPPRARFSSVDITNSTLTFMGADAADPGCVEPTTVSETLTLTGRNVLTFGSGCYVFGAAVNALEGSNTRFATAPGAAVVFVFAGGTLTTATDAEMSFGDATVYVNNGSISHNGRLLSFGNGAFYLWGGTMYNVHATSTLSFGNGPFFFYGGSIANYGTMTMGKGPFWFSGGSLTLHPSSTTSFGAGDVNFYGGTVAAGGRSLTFGEGGSASAGAGTVAMYGGSFSLTANSLTAVGVSFGFKGGTLSLLGIGTINATAPTAPNPTLGYRNLLFGIWGGAFNLYQANAQQDTMSGMVYAPVSNASIYGTQTVTPPPGGCFGVVSGVLDIYQNARINAAPCAGWSSGTSGMRRLVQ